MDERPLELKGLERTERTIPALQIGIVISVILFLIGLVFSSLVLTIFAILVIVLELHSYSTALSARRRAQEMRSGTGHLPLSLGGQMARAATSDSLQSRSAEIRPISPPHQEIMKKGWICQACGCENPGGTMFCSRCGSF